jgi:acetyl esterase/lipase
MAKTNDNVGKQSLLTAKALNLSMTAPRCPPYHTAQRAVAVGLRPHPDRHFYLPPSSLPPTVASHRSAHHHQHHEHLMDRFFYKPSRQRRRRLPTGKGTQQLKPQNDTLATSAYRHHDHHRSFPPLPHPHLPSLGPDTSSHATRLLGTVLPLGWQHRCRDGGGFRSVADGLVTAGVPLAAVSHPGAARRFVHLTRKCRRIVYGDDDDENTQHVDVFVPEQKGDRKHGMVFFVHGGAWGSGAPWLYRLVALPFLQLGLAVAVVGYRVYPRGNVQDQVDDLEGAFQTLVKEYPGWCCETGNNHHHLGTIVMGHSSGAHIALLWLVQRTKRRMQQQRQQQRERNQNITTFVGISGPYNIDHHFDYEAARGVEEISPLKPANGYTRANFLRNSPACHLQYALKDVAEEEDAKCVQDFFPGRCLLIHGIEDDTVPFTATGEAARVLRSCGVANCQEIYAPETGHQDAVVHLMLGGRVRNEIVDWLLGGHNSSPSSGLYRSKL